jgi:hypothetical protein
MIPGFGRSEVVKIYPDIYIYIHSSYSETGMEIHAVAGIPRWIVPHQWHQWRGKENSPLRFQPSFGKNKILFIGLNHKMMDL